MFPPEGYQKVPLNGRGDNVTTDKKVACLFAANMKPANNAVLVPLNCRPNVRRTPMEKNRWSLLRMTAASVLGALVFTPPTAQADAGGVGFWLPGSMGSLSAVPGTAGWSFTTVYLHLEANAGSGKELQQNASIVSGLHARADV